MQTIFKTDDVFLQRLTLSSDGVFLLTPELIFNVPPPQLRVLEGIEDGSATFAILSSPPKELCSTSPRTSSVCSEVYSLVGEKDSIQ